MFFFRKKRSESVIPASLLAFMATDIHSHLVPGVDDGVPDTNTAIGYIAQLQAMGISKIITTPHIMMDRYPNSTDTLEAPYRALSQALVAAGIHLPFHYAAEYYMDEAFEQVMKSPLLTISGNYVLVEISFMVPPPQFFQWLFELQAAGYQPVLAHPERYAYYHKDFEAYRTIKDRGVLLQMNLLSPTGYYGKHIQQAADKLLAAGLIDLTGTDLHHEKHLRAIAGIANDKKLRNTLERYPFKNSIL